MKRILKWTGIVLLLVVAVFVATVFGRQHLQFEAPYPDITASTDSAVIARGSYLVNGPAHCTGCHTDKAHETAFVKGEPVPLHGGMPFVLPVGTIYSRNITNDKTYGVGRLSDQEIARTLRYGVGSDGRAIFDFMPFYMLSDADLQAVISYLRTVPGDPVEVPPHTFNFLGKAVKAFLIKPMGPLDAERPKAVRPDTSVVYGEYLANSVSNCAGCHTERDLMTGDFIGPRFAGWRHMEGIRPGSFFNTPNLTPDPVTGHLHSWDFAQFKARFRAGSTFPDSQMPWANFARFSDDDLKAIWNYLHTLKPVANETGPLKEPAAS
ncbi:MAG: c-type cytochrome [Flavobacteriales bacterium]|nr:c-type cytochrome [Flavobacteriales bacterium]MCB9166835.1 c-type cytochrome [Flavobacteriales bacterium]